MNKWSDEETNEPLIADNRNFYKVEKWSKEGLHIEEMLFAGNNLDKARTIFARFIKRRLGARLTIRQRNSRIERVGSSTPLNVVT